MGKYNWLRRINPDIENPIDAIYDSKLNPRLHKRDLCAQFLKSVWNNIKMHPQDKTKRHLWVHLVKLRVENVIGGWEALKAMGFERDRTIDKRTPSQMYLPMETDLEPGNKLYNQLCKKMEEFPQVWGATELIKDFLYMGTTDDALQEEYMPAMSMRDDSLNCWYGENYKIVHAEYDKEKPREEDWTLNWHKQLEEY